MAQALRKPADGSAVIPDRLYFKIGDVARICGVETYVLRFWETQFPQLKPNKSGTGQRLYRRREVELALEIKRLVHAEGYTLAGAKQALDQGPRRGGAAQAAAVAQVVRPEPVIAQSPASPNPAVVAAIGRARAELREIAALLASPDPAPAPLLQRPRAKLIRVRSESDSLFPM